MNDPIIPEAIPEEQASNRPGRPKGAGESRAAIYRRRKRKALSLLVKGCDLPTVCKSTGISKAGVKEYKKELQAIFPEIANVEHFRAHKADIADGLLAGILKSMSSPDKLKKATLNAAAFAASKVNEIGRLERGLSTANIASFVSISLPKD